MRRFLLFAAILLWIAACLPKQYYVLSPEEDYSDDPSVTVRLLKVEEFEGDTRVILEIENRRSEPIALADATFQVFDTDEKAYPALVPPTHLVKPSTGHQLVLLFETSKAIGETFDLRIEKMPVKVWPIVFSKKKAPDFKATPDPQQGGLQRGPGRSGPY